MEVLSNHSKFYNMGTIKSESGVAVNNEIQESNSLRLNSEYKILQFPATEEIHIKPEIECYETVTDNYCNGYNFDNSTNIYDEWSEGDANVKYEYKEPEENFISIDDLKVKPFLIEAMKKDTEESHAHQKQNYESTVRDEIREVEDDEDDEVILIEDNEEEEIDENEVGEEVDWMDLDDQDKQSFECFLCNKKVASNYNLRRHMMIHTGERPFGCDICLKRFREFSDLKKHRKVHINEQGYTCMVCRKNTPSIKNATKCISCDRLDRQNRTRYGELTLEDVPCIEGSHKKAFVCPVCDRIFGSRHNLKRHYMIHTGEKPYKCDICEKYFREVSTLKKHMLTHSRIKLFRCVVCGKEYSDFGAYNRHKISHGNLSQHDDLNTFTQNENDEEVYLFECGECYKKFSNVSVYKDHLKLHSHDFTFQCYICKSMFRTKEKLNAHFVIHDYGDSE